MRSLYLLNVTIHVVAALVWLGGMLFLAAVGAPVLRRIESPELRSRLFREIGEQFRAVGWICIAILLVTGVLNLHFTGLLAWEALSSAGLWASPYGRALALKLALVGLMLVLEAYHDFVLGPRATRLEPGSPEALRFRKRASWLARINALLGLVLIWAAVAVARGG